MRTCEVFSITWNDIDLDNRTIKIIHYELRIKSIFYDLRGIFATISLRNGYEIKNIAEVLDHKRIKTTEKYYISTTNRDKENVAKKFEHEINKNSKIQFNQI